MTKTVIHLVIGIQDVTLLVFYTEPQCWQFRVISAGSEVFGEQRLSFASPLDHDQCRLQQNQGLTSSM